MTPSKPTSPFAFGERHRIAFLLCLCNVFSYADRTNIGVVVLEWSDRLTDEQTGRVLAAFFWGYILTQMPSGYLAKRWGGRAVLLAAMLAWTVFDVSTVVTYRGGSLALLFLSRAGLGLGEGASFPAQHALAAAWYPRHEKARLVGMAGCGIDVGTVLALVVSPAVVARYGWEYVFVLFGMLNTLWLAAWWLLAASGPETSSTISPKEREYILSERQADACGGDGCPDTHHPTAALRWILSSRGALAICAAHATTNYGWYVLLGWLPRYYKSELGVDLNDGNIMNSLYLFIPYSIGITGMLSAGLFSDYAVREGHLTVLIVRKICMAVSTFGPALTLLGMASGRGMSSPAVASAYLSVALFCARWCISGFWTNMLDLRPEYASHLMGVSNTFATVPGVVGNVITGAILGGGGGQGAEPDSELSEGEEISSAGGNWAAVWTIAAMVYAVGGLQFLWLAEGPPQEKGHRHRLGATLNEDSSVTSVDGDFEEGFMLEESATKRHHQHAQRTFEMHETKKFADQKHFSSSDGLLAGQLN